MTNCVSNWQIFVSAVNLGEQCFYYQACMYTDQNADCVQIKHNAICQCKEGYHLATVQKPMKRVFCSQGRYWFLYKQLYDLLA